MTPFARFWARKEPEIDPESYRKLQKRVQKLGEKLEKHVRDSKKDSFDLSLLYDKAQGAVARLREQTKRAKKARVEVEEPEPVADNGLQAMRERHQRLHTRG